MRPVGRAVTVFRDALGVPHIRSPDRLELAREQGLVTARDRGWQIEVSRWRSEGRLAERIGAAGVEWDRFARRARLADTAQRAYAALAAHDRAFVDAYVTGVNAGLAEETGRTGRRSAERRVLDEQFGSLTPHEPWRAWAPLGILLVEHALFSTFPRLLWNEHVLRTLGDDAVDLFAATEPAYGSNAWALHGSRTVSGKPLLAGDPHRVLELPGVYQQVRLACDEFDVVGLTFPGVPGVQHFGHTGSAAWGITNAIAHHVELFREEFSDDGLTALGPDGWAPVTRHAETIRVRRGTDVVVEVVETDRGPVVLDGLSVRFPARVASDVGISCLLPLLRARTAGDVADALRGWVDPVNRVLAADATGTVLSFDAGLVVGRHRQDRRLPHDAWSPAARRGPWHRLADPAPVTDVAVDANERPGGVARDLGRAYAPPYRARRIAALLETPSALGPDDMAAIHGDTLLGGADELLGWVRRASGLSAGGEALRDRLLAWDRHMDADSTDAALFAQWRSHVAVRLSAHPGLAPLYRPHGHDALFEPWLAVAVRVADALPGLLGATSLGIDGAAVVRDALELVASSGSGPDAWGDLHRLQPVPVLAGVGGPVVDPVPLSGDSDCVRCTASVPGLSDLSSRGSAARWVWDLSDRRRSRWGVPFGASGDPGSPHATDQLEAWAAAQTVPVVTDWHLLVQEESSTQAGLPQPSTLPDV
ncbi:penicillin acylase family protein [Cellulomonas sp. zg-ZUI188]|uniref:Penicillin acylase family protein n=1 Tax=Cellulomonas fengjieae TaxID=2819978 RepID=A0ABS3SKC5_9CELL|nr:penicillin acylase family protein [Cellulomonas fengjieae]QVI68040.1 penicillin acylase family protein [Cellulomonas fengjieae]